MKFSIKEFFSKCEQIHRKLRIWSHLLKKSLKENFFFCTVWLYKDRGTSYILLGMTKYDFDCDIPVQLRPKNSPTFDRFLQVSRVVKFSAVIAYNPPQNSPWFRNYFVCFPKRVLYTLNYFYYYLETFQNWKKVNWTSRNPFREFFSYVSRYDLFIMYNFKIATKRTQSYTTITIKGENIDNKAGETSSKKYTQVLLNTDYRLKVNEKIFIMWKSLKMRITSFIAWHEEKSCFVAIRGKKMSRK